YQFARDVQSRLATSLFVGLPILLLLAAVAGYVLMRRALKPVEAMINSADAAHELPTPLTIIRGEMELLLSKQSLPRELDRALANVLDEMTRLSGIVDSLITLSRMDSLWGKNAHSSVDLRLLATETMDQMNLMAVEKNIQLVK